MILEFLGPVQYLQHVWPSRVLRHPRQDPLQRLRRGCVAANYQWFGADEPECV
jgi:hypothetical protein